MTTSGRTGLVDPRTGVGGLQQPAGYFRNLLDHLLEGCQIISFDWRYLYVNDAVARHGRTQKSELLGRRMMEVYPGIDDTPLFDTLRRCMDTRTSTRVMTEFVYPDGATGWFELSVQPVTEGLFIMSLDMTQRQRAEALVASQLQRLAALRAIDLAILGTTDWRVAIKTVLEETKARLAVDVAAILQLELPASLKLAASIGFQNSPSFGVGVSLGAGLAGQAALEGRTITAPTSACLDLADLQKAFAAEGVQSACATPLIAKGRLLGVLVVGRRAPFEADQDWLSFFEALAGQAAMAIDSGESFADLQRSNQDLVSAYETTLDGWSRALDVRDRETEGHTQRVTEMTVRLARAAGLAEADLVHLRRGALLHDIGKMGVPDAILLKAGPLTPEEWVIMRQHPTIARDLLLPIAFLRPALDIPYAHHEKWDGAGYPRGLAGESIPLAARLFAVVDVWDALRSDRPYRPRWPAADVLQYLRQQRGTHFDPDAVDVFLRVLTE
jgi:PAS domain S-box-containing protein